LIDWCLTPTLTIFQLLNYEKKAYTLMGNNAIDVKKKYASHLQSSLLNIENILTCADGYLDPGQTQK
jgi:hypothetical protein